MKRSVGTADLRETISQASKKRKLEIPVVPSHEQSPPPVYLAEKNRPLIVWLKVQGIPTDHKCVKRIVAMCCLPGPENGGLGTDLGHIIGRTIDKTTMDPDRPHQTLFVSETLSKGPVSETAERPMKHGIETGEDETELMMRHMFRRDGTPRKEYPRKFLDSSVSLHLISEFELKPAYRGHGLAKEAMHSYLRAMQKRSGRYAQNFHGTVILMPAALLQDPGVCATVSSSKPRKTLVEIERALIASYEKAGFGVWSKGDDALRGTAITVMGMKVTGPKFRQLRRKPHEVEDAVPRQVL